MTNGSSSIGLKLEDDDIGLADGGSSGAPKKTPINAEFSAAVSGLKDHDTTAEQVVEALETLVKDEKLSRDNRYDGYINLAKAHVTLGDAEKGLGYIVEALKVSTPALDLDEEDPDPFAHPIDKGGFEIDDHGTTEETIDLLVSMFPRIAEAAGDQNAALKLYKAQRDSLKVEAEKGEGDDSKNKKLWATASNVVEAIARLYGKNKKTAITYYRTAIQFGIFGADESGLYRLAGALEAISGKRSPEAHVARSHALKLNGHSFDSANERQKAKIKSLGQVPVINNPGSVLEMTITGKENADYAKWIESTGSKKATGGLLDLSKKFGKGTSFVELFRQKAKEPEPKPEEAQPANDKAKPEGGAEVQDAVKVEGDGESGPGISSKIQHAPKSSLKPRPKATDTGGADLAKPTKLTPKDDILIEPGAGGLNPGGSGPAGGPG